MNYELAEWMNESKSVCITMVMIWGMVWELNELGYGLGIEAKVWDGKWEQLLQFCGSFVVNWTVNLRVQFLKTKLKK